MTEVAKGVGAVKTESGRIRKKKQIIIVLMLLVILGFLSYLPVYFYEHRAISNIPEPIQINMEDILAEAQKEEEETGKKVDIETEKTITGNGFRVKMSYLATYDIKGLVVILEDFDTKKGATSFDKAIPRDLGMAWGVVAENANKINWSHSGRALGFETKNMNWRQVLHSASNNHIVVEEGQLREKLKKVRRGDFIEIKGYLIGGEIDDGNGNEKRVFSSSISRTDHVEHPFDTRTSCEIIYLTDLEWLD